MSARRGRLSRSADFDRVYRQGKSHGGRALVLHAFPRGDDEPSRLGLSVSKKVGGAVERNKVKRLIRDAYDAHEATVRPGFDVVVVARADALALAERDGAAGVEAALAELLDKAGLR